MIATSAAGDFSDRPDAQLLAATTATRAGELARARRLATAALREFRRRGDLDGRMRTLNLLGAISFERGQLARAERHFSEALDLASYLEDSLITARACNNLASVIHLRGRPDEAVGIYLSALLAYQRIGDRRGAAETYHNLGMTFRQIEDWHEAERTTEQAVRHAELANEQALLALALTGRAELSIGRGETALALQELERAATLAASAGDDIGGGEVQRVRALVLLRAGDYRRAAEEAEAGRAIGDRYGSALLRAECAAAAALAWRAAGQANLAAERYREAIAGFRSLHAVKLLKQLEQEWGGDGR